MILFLSLALSSMTIVSLPGENIELILLMRQQVKELEKLVKSNELNAHQMKRAVDLSEQLTNGINATLLPFKDSREFAEAIIEMQKSAKPDQGSKIPQFKGRLSGAMGTEIERELKADQERSENLETFQQKILGANAADLKKLNEWDARVQSAGLGEVAKMNAQMGGKLLESNLRVSMQISELLSEFRSLRQEIVHQRINDNIVTLQGVESIRQPIANPMIGAKK